ncbi:hypothetical protein BC943DRAFT_68288 [Umbelopsis sp. AD052]|nr:hypothetical protein BC943DRAFT_68288 [Umbelopsis sp. AD052]
MDKEVPFGGSERQGAHTVSEQRDIPVITKSPLTPSKQIKAAEVNKENVRAKKVAVTEAPAISPRKRKSISVDTEVSETTKVVAKKPRKKVQDNDKEAVVPVTDYTKLIKDILTSTLSLTPEDMVQHFESARIYTTLKTDLLLHALDAVCSELDTHNVMPETGIIFEEEFGISEWLVVSLTDSLDVREKRLIWFLYALSSLNPTTRFFDRLCTWLSTTTITQLSAHTSKSCRLSRIFINLCKAADDMGRARVFCYDLLRESTPTFRPVVILANFAYSWNSTLVLTPSTQPTPLPADDLILKSVQLIVKKLAQDHLHDRRIVISLGHLQKCCQWPPLQQIGNLVDFLDDLSSSILHPEFPKLKDQNPGKFQEHRFNVLKATELVYYQYRDWEFTYQSFISMVAYPLLQDAFYIDFALELIGALGRNALYDAPEDKLGLAGLRSEMAKALSMNASSKGKLSSMFTHYEQHILNNFCVLTDEFQHQVSAATALLNLSNGKAILARPLIQWYREMTSDHKSTVPDRLTDAIKFITKDTY